MHSESNVGVLGIEITMETVKLSQCLPDTSCGYYNNTLIASLGKKIRTSA